MPPAAASSAPSPRKRRASRWTRATPRSPCRDVTRRACSRPIVQKMKEDGSNWSLNIASANQALLLRNEAHAPGHRPGVGRLGVLVVLRQRRSSRTTRPTSRARSSNSGSCRSRRRRSTRRVENFVKYMKQVGGTPDQFSAYSYAAVLAFADAVNAVVESRRCQRPHPHEPHHRDQGPHRLRRRRHARQAVVQGRQDHARAS